MKATEMSYVDFVGDPHKAVESAYQEGITHQRLAWQTWFERLPLEIRETIMRHRQGVTLEGRWHKDGSLTLTIAALPNPGRDPF